MVYTGHSGKLFERDFAGEIMDKFEDLILVNYGFNGHSDEFPQEDITWFLMEKPAQQLYLANPDRPILIRCAWRDSNPQPSDP